MPGQHVAEVADGVAQDGVDVVGDIVAAEGGVVVLDEEALGLDAVVMEAPRLPGRPPGGRGAAAGGPRNMFSGGGRAPSSTRGRFDCTMSNGTAGEMMACARCSGRSRDRSARAASSSPPRGRSCLPPGRGASAGAAPKKGGVGETS